jgi:carotenoid cleavage dioxygenase-like enzyme
MDLPVVFDLGLAMSGTMPYRWDDDYGARLGVLRRDDPYGTVRWFDVGPCYVFHPLNAHDEDGRIVLYVMRYPEMWRRSAQGRDRATLWRWTIDLAGGTVREEQVDHRPAEFPRVDDRPADDAAGGDGWLMTYVYDAGTDRSDLVVLDAGDLTAPPGPSTCPRACRTGSTATGWPTDRHGRSRPG